MVGGEGEKFNKFFAYTHWLPVIDVSFGRSFLPSEEKKHEPSQCNGYDGSGQLKALFWFFWGCKGDEEEEFLNFRKQTSLVCKLKILRIFK